MALSETKSIDSGVELRDTVLDLAICTKLDNIPLYLEYARPLTEARDQFHLATVLSVLSIAYGRRIFISEASRIKQVAKFLGAEKVGITPYDERWVYSHAADISSATRDEKPNTLKGDFKSVIVMAHGMDNELVKSYPSATAAAATGREYSREAAIISSLAAFIRALGFEAVGTSNDSAITIPYAIKAGMGEYGRNQMVITKEFGPRVRFSKVFTSLDLLYDKPKKFGVRQFCDICSKCADACPPKALPKGPPARILSPPRGNTHGPSPLPPLPTDRI